METSVSAVIRQHLIDPETCMRCNTCESVCPSGAISHDAKNYVVDPGKCRHSMACIPRCPTGAIDAPVRKILLDRASLPQDRKLEMVVLCGHGQCGALARFFPGLYGYRNTAPLDGDMEEWKKAGLSRRRHRPRPAGQPSLRGWPRVHRSRGRDSRRQRLAPMSLPPRLLFPT